MYDGFGGGQNAMIVVIHVVNFCVDVGGNDIVVVIVVMMIYPCI